MKKSLEKFSTTHQSTKKVSRNKFIKVKVYRLCLIFVVIVMFRLHYYMIY